MSLTMSEPLHDSEHRVRWTATVTLGLLLAAHTLMETGRDALFLANIPVERLPWVYIVVALLALWIVRVTARGTPGHSLRRRLILLQLLAAASVFGFWQAMRSPGPWLYYALYVWSGIISSVVVVTFWMLLGDLFTITQGKRFFASIAIGGSVGALGGAALATFIVPSLGTEWLLFAAACLFALSAVGPMTLSIEPEEEVVPRDMAPGLDTEGLRTGIRQILSHPYARRVAILVALASATLTLGDYLFKSVLAEEVPAEDLSIWLARIYFGLNLLSIAMLALGVTPFVRKLGVDRSLALLPILIALSTVGVFLGIALFAIVLLKAADGTLRYSLHKTAMELLFLPMDSGLRASVKGVIDLVGGSAAKALASVAILVLIATPEPRLAIAVILVALALVWALAALELRQPYLDVFRRTLSRGSIETRIDYPELDVASLESLIRALSDRDEHAVMAAMELLDERERCSLIPSLILYHPSPYVVAKAIDIFSSAGREQVLDFVDRLLEHEYASVRSAIVRAAGVLAPDRDQLDQLSRETCPCIRVSAVAGLLAQGWVEPEVADREFQAATRHSEPDTRMAVANAAKLRYAEIYRESLPALARDTDSNVAREAVRAMHKSEDPEFTATLVALLDDRRIRDLVREALLDRDAEALKVLTRDLEDPTTPPSVLRHIPRTISRFSSLDAIDILLHALGSVRSGMVRYKILRGLEPLLAEPWGRTAAKSRILEELRSTVDRSLFLLHNEAELIRGQEEVASRRTPGGRLLIDLVRDKRYLAASRIFLLLALLHPEENFRTIQGGIRSERATRRASGIELLEHLLTPDLRHRIVGLVSQDTPMGRLRIASPELARTRQEYGAAVRALADDSSEAVRAFAMYHAGEIDLGDADSIGPPVEAPADRPAASLRDRALGIIERLPEALARRAVPADGSTVA